MGPCRWPLLKVAAFLGDTEFTRALISLGADPSQANGINPTIQEIEEQFILGDGLKSQVHETVKTAIRFAECKLARFEVKRAKSESKPVFRYFVAIGSASYRIDIPFLSTGSIGAAIFMDPGAEANDSLISDLLSSIGSRGSFPSKAALTHSCRA